MNSKKRIILIVLLSMLIVVISSVFCFADNQSNIDYIKGKTFVVHTVPTTSSSYDAVYSSIQSQVPFATITRGNISSSVCFSTTMSTSSFYKGICLNSLSLDYGWYSNGEPRYSSLYFNNSAYFPIGMTISFVSDLSNVYVSNSFITFLNTYFDIYTPIITLSTPSNFRWSQGNILNWDHVLPQAQYEVQFSVDSSDWLPFDTVNTNRVECFIEGYYRVRAIPFGVSSEGYEASEWSSVVRYNPSAYEQLPKPIVTYSNFRLTFEVPPDIYDGTSLYGWAIYRDNQLISTVDTNHTVYFDVYQNGTYYATYSLGNQLSYPSDRIVVSDYGNVLPPDNPTPPSGGGESGEDPGIIDWIRYFIDKIDYFFDTILYGIKTIIGGAVQAISTFIEYITDFVSAVGDLFSFLPDEIVALITSCIFIVALVGILRVFL